MGNREGRGGGGGGGRGAGSKEVFSLNLMRFPLIRQAT